MDFSRYRGFRAGTQLVKEIAAVLFQPICLICGNLCGARSFCVECQPFIPLHPPWCERCGETLPDALDRCGECAARSPALDRARSAYWLTEEAKTFLHKIKYRGRFELLALPKTPAPFDLNFLEKPTLIPVPIHRSRYFERGFNQAEILAELLSKQWRLRIDRRGFQKIAATLPQTPLSKAQRKINLKRSFSWVGKNPPPRSVILIDDTYTTGTTLEVCAKSLKKAGCVRVEGWTLFRAPGFRGPKGGVSSSLKFGLSVGERR